MLDCIIGLSKSYRFLDRNFTFASVNAFRSSYSKTDQVKFVEDSLVKTSSLEEEQQFE